MTAINANTLALTEEGNYNQPNYAYVMEHEYSLEEVCEHARSSFKLGDDGTWDGIFWCAQALKQYEYKNECAKELARETRQSKRWILRGLQVYETFFEIKNKYPGLYFQHFINVVSLPMEEAIKWLDKADDGGWSAKRLYKEMTEAGDFTETRYLVIKVFEGELKESEDGFRVYDDEEGFAVVEAELDKLKGKDIKLVLSVKEEGTQPSSLIAEKKEKGKGEKL